MRGWLFLLSGCSFGLAGKDGDTSAPASCDTGAENCCTGTITSASAEADSLAVVAEVSCPVTVGEWALDVDGVEVSSAAGSAADVPVSVDLDLSGLALTSGSHTLTLRGGPGGGIEAIELASATFGYAADTGGGDSGDTGDSDTAPVDTDTGPPAQSNLSPSALSLSPELGEPGSSFTVSTSIYNFGDGDAAASTADLYWSSDETLDGADAWLGSIDVGEVRHSAKVDVEGNGNIPSYASIGTGYVLFVADSEAVLDETNEDDNVVSAPFLVVAIDLVATSLSIDPAAGADGAATTASWTVTNAGTEDASSFGVDLVWSADAWYDGGDTLLDSWTEPALAAGTADIGTTSVTIPDGASDGYVLLVVDGDGVVTETDNLNNTASAAYSIEDVDLSMTIDSLTPSTGSPGDSVSVALTVDNTGGDRAENFDVTLYASTDTTLDAADTELTSVTASYLDGGSSTSVALPVTVPSDATSSFYILGKVDADDAVVEADETNNEASAAFSIAVANLVPTLVGVSLPSAHPGDTENVAWQVDNTGSATSTGVNIGFYLSTDSTWSGDDTVLTTSVVPALSAGSSSGIVSTVMTIPSGTARGAWELLVVVDPDGTAVESDETDNTVVQALTLY